MALIDLLAVEETEHRMRSIGEEESETNDLPYYRTLLHNPTVVESMHDFHEGVIDSGPIDRELYEYVMVVVSEVNECEYCGASHRKKLKDVADLSLSEVSAISSGDYSSLPECERAIVEFAERVAADPNAITADDVDSLREIGFDEGDVLQLVAVVGECNLANTMMSAFDVRPTDG